MSSRSQRVRIVTDTTASLPPGYAAAHGLTPAPQTVIFGEESFLEERELSPAQFVARLRTAPALPTTSAPPVGEFVAIYRRELVLAPTILSIHPSADVSGTVRSAQTALASDFAGADIRILDTRTVAANLGSLVRCAVAWAEAGEGADAIMARLQGMIPRSRTYFLIRTLEFLEKGGRIGKASALAGSILQIKPILEFRDGVVQPVEKVRTHARALERLVEIVRTQCPATPEAHLVVMHMDAEADAAQLCQRLSDLAVGAEIPLVGVGSAIGAHAGPGVVGVGFFAA